MQDKLEELDMSSRQEDVSEDRVIIINLNPMGSNHRRKGEVNVLIGKLLEAL